MQMICKYSIAPNHLHANHLQVEAKKQSKIPTFQIEKILDMWYTIDLDMSGMMISTHFIEVKR